MTTRTKTQKRVLIITYYWPPAGGPGVQRWLKFSKYLPTEGITPVILTVDPSKAEYPIRDITLEKDVSPETCVYTTPCQGLYDLYKKFTKSGTAPYSGFVNENNPNLKQKIARFIRGNFFLPDARRGWNKYAYRKAKTLIQEFNIQTIITTGPPMSTHLIGLKLKQHFPVKWIADFRDPWTDIYYYNELYPTAIAKSIDRRFERQVLEQSDLVFSANFIQEKLARKSPKIDTQKIVMLTNGYDDEDFQQITPRKPHFTITYAGTLASSYPIQTFVEAVAELAKQQKIVLQFVGRISDDHKQLIMAHPDIEAHFPGFVSHEQAIQALQSSHLLLLVFHDTAQNEGHMPGKLFEYLAAHTPILCLEDRKTMAGKIIEDCHSGIAISFHDKTRIKNYISTVYNNTQFQGDMEQIANYSRRNLTRKLSQYID